jgi:hypothetical protein
MKKIYYVYCEEIECAGMLDEKYNLLDRWAANDASWSEYFEGFLRELGFRVVTRNNKANQKFVEILKEECPEEFDDFEDYDDCDDFE